MHRALLTALLFASACTVKGNFDTPDADPDHPFPPPRTDLVPALGSETTLEIACWNIENFPASAATTPGRVADVIASLDLDVVIVEEIADETAWEQLLARLPEHEGVLSTHRYTPDEYQKIGIIYRSSLVTVGAPTLLFPSDSYTFPRPPFSIPITVDGNTIELVGVHLKAGGGDEDEARRTAAIIALDNHLRAQVDGGGEAEVVVLGDYNQRIVADDERVAFAPLLSAPERYTVRTEALAAAGRYTYLGFGGELIDHLTTTAALDARWTGAHVEIPQLDQLVPGYRGDISDHLPVVLVTPR
ncbi:MAG: endonuclease/exonuclease/phosphatase family protein [Kofleriaceae bacterium]